MGTVYLVGAGPGDPGLLTLRAAELLTQADIVVHDALVGEGVMDRIPPGVERVDVGKRGGGRATSQAFIHRILVECAARARVVVRLKGGDPFIFGRGGEEALALQAAGVRFEVVPGVTAALGAAAYAGIPLTHRGMSSAVTFVTGTAGDAGSGAGDVEGADWGRLAAAGGTLVVYMGMRVLPRLVDRLLQGGRPGETPATIVEWGTLPQQRVVAGSLSTIAVLGAAAGFGSPAILVVGEVAALGHTLEWFGGVANRCRARTGEDVAPGLLLPPGGPGLPAVAGGA